MGEDVDRPKLVAFTPKRATDEPWNPVDALAEFQGKVIEEKIVPASVMIFWIEVQPSGRRVPRYWLANVSTLEMIGYGELIKTLAMDDWREA